MAKFDIYPIPQGRGYLLECQADLLSALNTRLVASLLPIDEATKPAARLNPVFDIAGEPHVMVTQFAATIPLAELKNRVMSLAQHDLAIGNALDMLITGF